jgi:hypothetical protein
MATTARVPPGSAGKEGDAGATSCVVLGLIRLFGWNHHFKLYKELERSAKFMSSLNIIMSSKIPRFT